MANSNRGLYATACESSKYKNKIDEWLNEGKSFAFISRQLTALGDKISEKSVAKYAKYREEYLHKELMKDPIYEGQIKTANENLIEEIGKFKQINIMNHLAETIEHCAELVGQSRLDEIKIKNVQDLRYVQMTMLETIKIYSETIMKAQAFQKIEEDPSLLKPQVTINAKSVLVDMLSGLDENAKARMIDNLRGSFAGVDHGRVHGSAIGVNSSTDSEDTDYEVVENE